MLGGPLSLLNSQVRKSVGGASATVRSCAIRRAATWIGILDDIHGGLSRSQGCREQQMRDEDPSSDIECLVRTRCTGVEKMEQLQVMSVSPAQHRRFFLRCACLCGWRNALMTPSPISDRSSSRIALARECQGQGRLLALAKLRRGVGSQTTFLVQIALSRLAKQLIHAFLVQRSPSTGRHM